MTRQVVVSLTAVQAARIVLDRAGLGLPTPLVPFGGEPAGRIWLKLENLLPVGSFKLRGSLSALNRLPEAPRSFGVWTASAGNMGYALAWAARRMAIPCTVIVPQDAPEIKLSAIRQQGAEVVVVPFAQYQQIQNRKAWTGGGNPPQALSQARLVHPFADPDVMAGNATIGLEILEQLPEVEAIVAPFGGGGLTCGIAAAVRAVRPEVRVIASEVETGAPLAASLAEGKPVEVSYRTSFISGMGAPYLFDEMWPLAGELLDESLVVGVEETADSLRQLATRNKIIAEGAAGTALAAAQKLGDRCERVVAVITGGNIDLGTYAKILPGGTP